jgi:hypothetical protein
MLGAAALARDYRGPFPAPTVLPCYHYRPHGITLKFFASRGNYRGYCGFTVVRITVSLPTMYRVSLLQDVSRRSAKLNADGVPTHTLAILQLSWSDSSMCTTQHQLNCWMILV